MQKELLEALNGLTMPIWADDRVCLGREIYQYRSRTAALRAAAAGHIPSILVGRKRIGLCAPVRRQLGLDQMEAA